jgi:hypothetical protein
VVQVIVADVPVILPAPTALITGIDASVEKVKLLDVEVCVKTAETTA